MLLYKRLSSNLFLIFVLLFPALSATSAQDKIWKELTPTGEEFSVQMPGEITEIPFYEKDSQKRTGGYRAEFNGNYYFVFCDPLGAPSQTYTILRFAGYEQPSAVLSVKDNVQGKTFSFTDADGMIHAALAISGKSRACIFQASTRDPKSPDSRRFFMSIVVNGNAPMPTELSTQPNLKAAARIQLIAPVTSSDPTIASDSSGDTGTAFSTKNVSSVTGQSGGLNRGEGNGPGSGSVAPASSSPPVSTPIRVLSKPRPNYTNLARYYQIQGRALSFRQMEQSVKLHL